MVGLKGNECEINSLDKTRELKKLKSIAEINEKK